jgi:hypothetical protein
MDLAKVLQQLHEELENLNAAILSLERLQESGKSRGKDSAWMGEISGDESAVPKRRGRPKTKEVGESPEHTEEDSE